MSTRGGLIRIPIGTTEGDPCDVDGCNGILRFGESCGRVIMECNRMPSLHWRELNEKERAKKVARERGARVCDS